MHVLSVMKGCFVEFQCPSNGLFWKCFLHFWSVGICVNDFLSSTDSVKREAKLQNSSFTALAAGVGGLREPAEVVRVLPRQTQDML